MQALNLKLRWLKLMALAGLLLFGGLLPAMETACGPAEHIDIASADLQTLPCPDCPDEEAMQDCVQCINCIAMSVPPVFDAADRAISSKSYAFQRMAIPEAVTTPPEPPPPRFEFG